MSDFYDEEEVSSGDMSAFGEKPERHPGFKESCKNAIMQSLEDTFVAIIENMEEELGDIDTDEVPIYEDEYWSAVKEVLNDI